MSNSLDDKLESIFKNVNEWLKFAEQKNAALVVLNGSSIWGLSLILRNTTNLSKFELISSSIVYLLITLSTLLCLISFTPVLQNPWLSVGEKNESDNCLYFGHIAKYDEFDYLKMVNLKLKINKESFTNFELDIASQIIINSKIAIAKYQKFQTSLTLTIASITALFITMFSIYILR